MQHRSRASVSACEDGGQGPTDGAEEHDMHPTIEEKLEMMREEKRFNRAEYRVTRDMHRGAKALAAITQPIIDTLTKERDEARKELAGIKDVLARAAKRRRDERGLFESALRGKKTARAERDKALARVAELEAEHEALLNRATDAEAERDEAMDRADSMDDSIRAIGGLLDIDDERAPVTADEVDAAVQRVIVERDKALVRVAELDERIKAVLDACPLERGFEMNSAAPSLYVRAHLNVLTKERDAARAERDRACATRDEAIAHLGKMEAAQPVPAPLEWLPNTGEDPGAPWVAVRFGDGSPGSLTASSSWDWTIVQGPAAITHYLPIPAPPRED